MWFVRPASLISACAYAQSYQSLCKSLKCSLTVKRLTGKRLEFLSLNKSYTGSSESTLVKIPHCLESTFHGSIMLTVLKRTVSKHMINKNSKLCAERPSKKDQILVFKTDYRLMQVKSIAKCSKRAFCNTFDLH